MKRNSNRYSLLPKTRSRLLLLLLIPALACCSKEEQAAGQQPQAPETFVVSYNIPDVDLNEVTARAGTTPSWGTESQITSLLLLFFEQDDYGNGEFVGSLTGHQDGNSLEKTGSVEMTVGGTITNESNYNVLVFANAEKYAIVADIETFCAGMTENLVKFRLRPSLPSTDGVFTVPQGYLPMSGTAVKEAGKDLKVTLLRAVVRVDVGIKKEVNNDIVLEEALLANITPVISLFSDPRDEKTLRLFGDPVLSNENAIIGGLYATESYITATDDRSKMLTQRTCLLVKCRKVTYTGDRLWYRVDVNIDDQEIQYLKRNNVYRVTINSIRSLGAKTPEEAYYADASLISSVTIQQKWKDSGMPPPGVDVN